MHSETSVRDSIGSYYICVGLKASKRGEMSVNSGIVLNSVMISSFLYQFDSVHSLV